ncbi:flagellar protein FliS [Bacillus bombysepticus]|uniref:flagellar protein FliS n=1 Tax=Bacillus bombysepticus TaxID=658666 RepID=UPI003015B0E6
MGNFTSYNQAETNAMKLTMKMYQYAILHLKKVKHLYGGYKFKEGEPHLIKAILIITELSLQLTTDEQLKTQHKGNEELASLVEDLRNTYQYSLYVLEHIRVTKDIRNIDKVINSMTKLYKAFNGEDDQIEEQEKAENGNGAMENV